MQKWKLHLFSMNESLICEFHPNMHANVPGADCGVFKGMSISTRRFVRRNVIVRKQCLNGPTEADIGTKRH